MAVLIVSLSSGLAAGIASLVLVGLVRRRKPLAAVLRSARRSAPVPRWWRQRVMRARRRSFDAAATAWVDLLYVASASGMNLRTAVAETASLTEEPLRRLLGEVQARSAAGGSFLNLLEAGLEERGEEAAAQVAHLLTDSSRRGLALAPALAGLRGDLLTRQRHRILAQVKTLGLKITLGTVLFLFPPALAVVLLPSILTFLSW